MSDPERMPPDALADMRSALDELGGPSGSVSFEHGCMGYGASLETVIAVVTGLLAAGPLIEQNLRAMERIGSRVRRVLRKLREHGSVLVSEPVALSMVMNEMQGRGISLASARLIASHVIPVANYSVPPEAIGSFRAHPERYYLFVLQDDRDDTYLVICRSTGAIEDLRRLPTGNYMEYAGIKTEPAGDD